jgi:hypothetical protein
MEHAPRLGHDTLLAPPGDPLRRCRLHALLSVLPFVLQIRRRGGLLAPVVLLVLRRLLMLPVIRRRGGLPPVVLLVLRRPLLLVLPVIRRHGGLPLLLMLLLIPVAPLLLQIRQGGGTFLTPCVTV